MYAGAAGEAGAEDAAPVIALLLGVGMAQDLGPLLGVEVESPEEVVRAWEDGDRARARTLAEAWLRRDPREPRVRWVLGKVEAEEANLAQALYHFDRALAVLEEQAVSGAGDAGGIWCQVLADRVETLAALERAGRYLQEAERYNAACSPPLVAETAWLLMKEGRLEEARARAREGLASEDPWQQTLGANVLCALATSERDRLAAVEACEEALRRDEQMGMAATVTAYNAALARVAVLDFFRADELFERAAGEGLEGSTNPWVGRALLALGQGRANDAIAALEAAQRWNHRQDPVSRVSSRAELDAAVALVLAFVGEEEAGLRFVERALRYPDRLATSSASHDAIRASTLVLRMVIRRAWRERQRERAAAGGVVQRWWGWLEPDVQGWSDRLVLAGLFTDGALLDATFAVYHDRGAPVPPWLLGDLVGVLGPGVVQAVLDRQRIVESFEPIHTYYDAIEAEVAWWRGEARTAELVERALADLPEEEVLLRARVAALGADRAWWSGERTRATQLYEEALRFDPGVFRRLGLAIPVRVEGDGPEARALGRSPRFRRAVGGLVLQVEDGRACLMNPGRNRIRCASFGEGPLAERIEAWHGALFALRLEGARLDLRSLDSTTTQASQDRREALERLLRETPAR